jgi:hypothetical protein
MLRARWILALTAAATVAVSVADARPPTGKCRSARGNVIAINKLVVAYELGRPDSSPGNDAISGRLIGCLRATGNKVQLSGSTFGEYWFDRPARAVKVRGTTIGFAAVVDPGYGSTFVTQISFVDMRRPRSRVAVTTSGLVGSLDFALAPARAGASLEARRSAAWIRCPELDEPMNADPRPNCVRAGLSANAVYAVAAGSTTPVRIASHRTIDPLSVRVRSGRVSWVQGGKRRSAPMPR